MTSCACGVTILNDQDIQDLVRLPKLIVARRPATDYREENGSRRCDLDLQSSRNDGRSFTVFIRQNLRLINDFTFGLRYMANEGKLTTITLVRYNGPHGDSSRAPDGHYANPHIHYITEVELAAGHSQPQENHRVLINSYNTFEEALWVFFDATSTSNYQDYFPDALQGRLFSGH